MTSIEFQSRLDQFSKRLSRTQIWDSLRQWSDFYRENQARLFNWLMDANPGAGENAEVKNAINNFHAQLKGPALRAIHDGVSQIRVAVEDVFNNSQIHTERKEYVSKSVEILDRFEARYDGYIKHQTAKFAALLVAAADDLRTWYEVTSAFTFIFMEDLRLPDPHSDDREMLVLNYPEALNLAEMADVIRAFYVVHNFICAALGVADEIGAVKVESGSLIIVAYLFRNVASCIRALLSSKIFGDFTLRGAKQNEEQKLALVEKMFSTFENCGIKVSQEQKAALGEQILESVGHLVSHRPRFLIDASGSNEANSSSSQISHSSQVGTRSLPGPND